MFFRRIRDSPNRIDLPRSAQSTFASLDRVLHDDSKPTSDVGAFMGALHVPGNCSAISRPLQSSFRLNISDGCLTNFLSLVCVAASATIQCNVDFWLYGCAVRKNGDNNAKMSVTIITIVIIINDGRHRERFPHRRRRLPRYRTIGDSGAVPTRVEITPRRLGCLAVRHG